MTWVFLHSWKHSKKAPPSLIGRPVRYSTHWALFPETTVIAQHLVSKTFSFKHLVSKTFPGGTLSSQPINHDHYENLIKHQMLPPDGLWSNTMFSFPSSEHQCFTHKKEVFCGGTTLGLSATSLGCMWVSLYMCPSAEVCGVNGQNCNSISNKTH